MGWAISALRDYLVVDFDTHQNLLWVNLYDDLRGIRHSWGPQTTVSPLWPIGREKDHPVRSDGLDRPGFLILLNGRQAGSILSDLKPNVSDQVLFWMSVGFYSVVIFVPVPEEDLVKEGGSGPFEADADFAAQTSADAVTVAEWIAQNQTQLSAEAWLLLVGEHRSRDGSEVSSFTYIACTQQLNELHVSDKVLQAQSLLLSVADLRINSPAGHELEELVATASNIIQRSIRSPLGLDDVVTTSLLATQHFVSQLGGPPQQDLEIGYLLSEIAKGLTELEQQAASGVWPVRYSASTLWPHTLLGLATAIRGLCRLDAFVASRLATASFSQQLTSLRRSHGIEEKISKLLGRPKLELRIPKASFSLLPEHERERPLSRGATFGRQASFDSTTTHIRVPRHCLTGANSVAESIFPICHEFAKAPAAAIIAQTFDAALQDDHLSGFWSRYRSRSIRYSDDATALLDYCVELVVREHKIYYLGDDDGISTDQTAALYDKCRDDPNILRRFFAERYNEFTQPISDSVAFIYFYRSDVQFFIQSYLASWLGSRAADPAKDSIELVVSRIIGVLAARRYGGDTFSSQRLKDDVIASLGALQGRWRDRLSFAAAYIQKLPSAYLRRAEFNASIGFIVHQFFMSDELLSALWSDAFARGGRLHPEAYSTTPGSIDEPLRIGNPLAFLFSCARDLEPDEARTVWLLHHLAYYDEIQEA